MGKNLEMVKHFLKGHSQWEWSQAGKIVCSCGKTWPA